MIRFDKQTSLGIGASGLCYSIKENGSKPHGKHDVWWSDWVATQTWQEAAEAEIEHNVMNGWQIKVIRAWQQWR